MVSNINDTSPVEAPVETFTSTEFGSIRALSDEQGEPLFVASDIAKTLGYGDATHMTRRLDDDEKGLRQVETLGGVQQMTSETEPLHYHQVLSWVRTQENVWFTPVIRRHMEAFDEDACACEITGWCDFCGYRTIEELENVQGRDRRRLLEIVERHATFKTKAE